MTMQEHYNKILKLEILAYKGRYKDLTESLSFQAKHKDKILYFYADETKGQIKIVIALNTTIILYEKLKKSDEINTYNIFIDKLQDKILDYRDQNMKDYFSKDMR